MVGCSVSVVMALKELWLMNYVMSCWRVIIFLRCCCVAWFVDCLTFAEYIAGWLSFGNAGCSEALQYIVVSIKITNKIFMEMSLYKTMKESIGNVDIDINSIIFIFRLRTWGVSTTTSFNSYLSSTCSNLLCPYFFR